jgi:excisionase family DNA binding protein
MNSWPWQSGPKRREVMADKLLTQKEVAAMLRVSLKTVQLLRRNHRLPFERYGHRTVRVRESALAQFKQEAGAK